MFELRPAPKPKHNRRVKKRAARTEFSRKTREEIAERDGGRCVRCYAPATDIHHINFRSELTADVSHKRNGCCVCRRCHAYAHSGKDGREWFVIWKNTHLDENGDYIKLPFDDW